MARAQWEFINSKNFPLVVDLSVFILMRTPSMYASEIQRLSAYGSEVFLMGS